MFSIVSAAAAREGSQSLDQAFVWFHTLHTFWRLKRSFDEISADAQYTQQYIAGAAVNWASDYAPGAKPILSSAAQIAFVSAMFLETIESYKKFHQAFCGLTEVLRGKYLIVVHHNTIADSPLLRIVGKINSQLAIKLQGKLILLKVRVKKVYQYTNRLLAAGIHLSYQIMELTEAHSKKFQVLENEHRVNCIFLNAEKVNRLLPKNRVELIEVLKEREEQVNCYLKGIGASYNFQELIKWVEETSQDVENVSKTISTGGKVVALALDTIKDMASYFLLGKSNKTSPLEKTIKIKIKGADALTLPPMYERETPSLDMPLKAIEQVG